MKRLYLAAVRTVPVAAVVGLLLLGFTAPASADVVGLSAEGSGAEEVPPAGTDTVAASFDIDTEAGTLTYTVTFDSEEAAAAAHIHQGAAGTNGDVVIPFDAAAVDEGETATVTVDPALLAAIIANPAGYYINVHTATYPGGAARGQLSGPAAPPSTSTSDTSGPTTSTGPTSSAAPTSGTTTSSAATAQTSSTSSHSMPTAVKAGTGGQFAGTGNGIGGATITLIAGAVLVAVAAVGLLTKRRRNG